MKFQNEVFTKYIYHLSNILKLNGKRYERHFKYIKELKVPIPPVEIQKQIVDSCQAIDNEFEDLMTIIKNENEKKEQLIINIINEGHSLKKLANIAKINPSKTEITDVNENIMVSFIEMASVSEYGFISNKEDRFLKDVKQGSYKYFKEGDIILAKITPCMENGKCAIAIGLTNEIGFGSSEFHVFRVNEEFTSNKYVFTFLNREVVRNEAERIMTGSSGHRRVPEDFYKNFEIPIPKDKKRKKKFIVDIESCETNIMKARNLMNGIERRKEDIIKYYL